MDQNGKILRELVNSVRELKEINKEQHKMNIEQRKMNMYAEKRLQLHYELLREQKQWLKDHEVRLRTLEK